MRVPSGSGFAQALLFHLLLLFPVAASAYIAMQLPFDFSDHQLSFADSAIGFDWKATIGFIDERPWLGRLFGYAYFGIHAAAHCIPIAALTRLPFQRGLTR